ncbi:DUF3306 domain-containing protein [Stappia sp. ES.058]|uniref:DUF3306 domain-containing protein n=1 Tax=Stappia sp. ES.058 TaxID=1881061 RepID=UPI00087A444B|nr:DUF3306 domain-containing protein [Stappia sp. ES.058]SDU05362.1 Protein of unknown function [Stappia sp. ES.058]
MSEFDKDTTGKATSGKRPAVDEDAGFLSRWSQRKRAVRQQRERDEARLAPAPLEQAEKAAEAARIREENQAAAEEVDLETLAFDSDYSVFLKEGVSKQLKNTALRKLWRSNPVLACVDGLNDYDEDFRTVETLVEGLKTSWQVGNGYGWMEERDKADAAAKEAAEGEVPSLDPAAGEAPDVAGSLQGADRRKAEQDADLATRPETDERTDTASGSSGSEQGDALSGHAAGKIHATSPAEPVPVLSGGSSGDREGVQERAAASRPEPPERPARRRMRFS